MQNKYLLSLLFVAGTSFAWSSAPNTAMAADCGNDPIYERNMTGVTLSGLRVRSIACMEGSEILTTLPQGTTVKIIAETDGWYKVKVGDKVGWMGAQLIRAQSGSATETEQEQAVVETDDSDAVKYTLVGINENDFVKLQNGNETLLNRLRNKIVLRVNHFGKAYLVNQDGSLRLLTGEEVKKMRQGIKTAVKQEKVETGASVKIRKIVGVTEADFGKLEAGDAGLRSRLNDMIVLRVHFHGKAYWVNPAGGLKFLEPGDVGYYLTQQVKEQVKAKVETKMEEKKTASAPVVSGNIALEVMISDPGKVKLSWATKDLDSSLGFKVVMSQSANPVYPGNDYHYLTNKDVRNDSWTGLKNGVTYHFRVCQYLGGACGTYSNDVAITMVTNGAAAGNVLAGTIALNATALGDGKVGLEWTLANMDSAKGFKVVVSEQANPVYPGNDYHYFSEPDKSSDTWTGLQSGKTYHFRVCEYLGGYCGTYSNDVAVSVQ